MNAAVCKRWWWIAGLTAYALVAAVAIPYLAGMVYFLANKTLPHGVALGTWLNYWHFYSGDPVQGKRLEFAMGAAILSVVGGPLLLLHAVFNQARSLHGDARFARSAEVRAKRLFGTEGVIVGKLGGQYLHVDGKAPLLLAAPTRQGKGAGVVIPNLLSYPHSIVVLDPKLENFQITSLFRQKHGHAVYLFNPFSERGETHRWNPMDAIRRDPNLRVVDATSIGETLYPRTSDESGMWNDLARDLFIGFTLYLIETPSLPCTFGEVLRQMSGKGGDLKQHVQRIMTERHRGKDALSDACYEAFGRFCSAEERQVSSIKITATAPLLVFQNAYVDAATSATDFDVARVRKDRMTIYVGVPADMMMTAGLIVNLFFSHLIRQNIKDLPAQNADIKHPCLVLLDEFTSLGAVGIIAKTIGQISGYGMRLVFIIQGVSQLISLYGEHDARTMEDNCDVQVLYPPRNQKDANEYSQMLGVYTAKATSVGSSRPRAFGSNTGTASENISDQRRALLLPQELRELEGHQEILIVGAMKPILCEKAYYYADPKFMNRLKALSPTLKGIRGLPTEADLTGAALTRRELSIELPRRDVNLHVAKVEGRIRPVKLGEPIDVEALTLDAQQFPRLYGAEPVTGEAVREATLEWLDRLDGVGAPGADGSADDLPLREPDGFDRVALAVHLEAAAARLPALKGHLKAKRPRPSGLPAASESPAGRVRSRGVVDLAQLKKIAAAQRAVGG